MRKLIICMMLLTLIIGNVAYAQTTNPYDNLPEVGTQGVMNATIEFVFNDTEFLVRDEEGQLYNIHITDQTIISPNLDNLFVVTNKISVSYTITMKSLILQADAHYIDYHPPEHIGDIEVTEVGKVLAFVDNDSILIENPITKEQTVVHIYDDTIFRNGVSHEFEIHNYVIIQYNGIATDSIPKHINAIAIVYNDDTLPSNIAGLYYKAANTTLKAYFHVDDLSIYDVSISNIGNEQRWLKYLDPETGAIKFTAKVNVDDYSVFMISSSQAYDQLVEEYMVMMTSEDFSSKDLYDYKYSKTPLTEAECQSLIYQFIAQSPYWGKSLILENLSAEKVFDSQAVEYYVYHYQTVKDDQTVENLFIKIDAYMGLVTEVSGDL